MEHRTHCNRDCPDACGLIATVEDGRVTRLVGDPDHPVTRGFICSRTRRFLSRQYAPDRLTTPLLRDGGGFRPIGWDDALDRIAETMLSIRAESGPAAILQYGSGGSLGLLKGLTGAFFNRFGPVTVKSGSICSGAGNAAQQADFGESDSHDLFDLLNSRTIVLWGKNPYISSVHLLPILREARARGARLIQIDPVRHRGADNCELYLQPRPGGDAAIAMGVMRRLFERGWTDPDAADYCDNLDLLERNCFARTPEEWAERADVPTDGIERLAELYADGPSTILVGWGMQRQAHGSSAVRRLDALTAISGNLGVPGGGVSFYFKRKGAFDDSVFKGPADPPRAIPEPLIGPGILDARNPEIRMVWVHGGNPVAMLPESATVARALESRDLTVVVDAFLTDTARCAHIVLPTTTMLEDDDLVGSYGHHWIGEVRPVVAPPDGVKTDYGIVQELAGRVGLGEEFSDDVETWKRRLLRGVDAQGASLEHLGRSAVRNPRAAELLFPDRLVLTASGRVNLIRDIDADPPRTTEERPLYLMAIATDKAQASQWNPKDQEGRAHLTVHPGAANGFAEGDAIRVESELGSLEVVLRFDSRQRRDVALMDKGGWFHRGRSANAIIPARVTDDGGGAPYYDTPVRLLPL